MTPPSKLGLNEPEPPQPAPKTRRKPGPKRKTTTSRKPTTAGAMKTGGGVRYLIPAAADHVILLGILFTIAATLTVWLGHQEIVAKAMAAAGHGHDYSDVWNQGHRWAQYVAGVLLAVLTVTGVDRLVFTGVTFPEVVANRALPGREHIFEPLSDAMRAGYLRYYGAVYGSAIIGGVLILGV